ncbi:MAG TPA: hypothetical protein VLC28_15680 [Flavitalea sp.]|nr:hypothetical protein [Flavitalea sp.]
MKKPKTSAGFVQRYVKPAETNVPGIIPNIARSAPRLVSGVQPNAGKWQRDLNGTKITSCHPKADFPGLSLSQQVK